MTDNTPVPAHNNRELRPDRVVQGVAMLAAKTWWRGVKWSADIATTTGTKIIDDVRAGRSATDIALSATEHVLGAVRDALQLPANDSAGITLAKPQRPAPSRVTIDITESGSADCDELRRRGAELLRRSADVTDVEDTHPAYARIINQLAPDEARILRFLAAHGAQPVVDVRTSRPFDVGSEMIAEGLSMVAERSGCRYTDRNNAYTNNLVRLGLVRASPESVAAERYQVLEVQPDVVAACRRAGRAHKTVRRSIHLTPFGEDFCRAVIPSDPSVGDGL